MEMTKKIQQFDVAGTAPFYPQNKVVLFIK
jgi:hypothetical protein